MVDKKKGDLILASVLTLLSGMGLTYVLATFPRKERIYSGIPLFLLCILSLAQAFLSFRALGGDRTVPIGKTPRPTPTWEWSTKAAAITIMGTIMYVALLNVVGFVVASAILALGLPICLGYRNVVAMCLLAAAIIVAVHLLFAELHVPVPKGLLWRHLLR